ncbi:MAG TPA: hypothetical protein DC006_00770 [Prevotellaceae bacterium]|nr:hypothetical protein [Prevotellaceae bacterium]HBE55884.1 hypothetical protein [Prevotellaceae bacterium]
MYQTLVYKFQSLQPLYQTWQYSTQQSAGEQQAAPSGEENRLQRGRNISSAKTLTSQHALPRQAHEVAGMLSRIAFGSFATFTDTQNA